MKKVILVLLVALLAVAAAGCAQSSSSDPAPPKPAQPSYAQILTDNWANSMKLCDAYFSLVNQGWTDDNIYKQLENAGAFDSYSMTAAFDFFHATIRWCYKNATQE